MSVTAALLDISERQLKGSISALEARVESLETVIQVLCAMLSKEQALQIDYQKAIKYTKDSLETT